MTDLINITEKDGKQLVSARELHEGLKVEKAFSTWIQLQLENVDAIENVDFFPLKEKSIGGRPSIDYVLTMDIAKEICMVIGAMPRTNDETKKLSKEFRKYFIQCEKKLKELSENSKPQLPNDYLSALKALVASEEERQRLEEENAKQEPFVKVAKERLLKGEKISITDISKSLDLKRGQLTTYLKTNGYLNKKHNEVNKKGEGMFGVYKEGNFNCIGILENGIDFINEHLEEIKISPCRYSRNN